MKVSGSEPVEEKKSGLEGSEERYHIVTIV
jgi:hypothetical protein